MIPRIEGLSVDNWKRSDPKTRLESLAQLERALAAQEDRSPCLVNEDSPEERMDEGRYRPETKEIYINKDLVSSSSSNPYLAVHTLLHESRHAYQHDAILRNDPTRAESEEQFNDWKMAYNGGELPKNSEHAKWQPVEVDARKSSNQGLVELYGDSPEIREMLDRQRDVYRDESGELQERARQAVAEAYAARQSAAAEPGLGKDTAEPSSKEEYDLDQGYGY